MRPSDHSACLNPAGFEIARSEAENLLGDFAALLQQIGAPVLTPAGGLNPAGPRIRELPSLQVFLQTYFSEILVPLELPAIAEARAFACRGQARELIDLDRRLTAETRLAPFAAASQATGVHHLQRLRPLRGERTVRRYCEAVASGRAAGWHTLVYGLTMAVYSFPLRQALLHYARQTLAGLACAAAGPVRFIEPACQEMLGTLAARLPAAIEGAVPDGGIAGLAKTSPSRA